MLPCPRLPERMPGHGLVTGWLRHERGAVWELVVEGEPRPIGVTGEHPLWSPERNGWAWVRELRLGERLLARDGTMARVVSLVARPCPEPVYNIQVEGDHCYRVGEQGLLVHNASAPCTDPFSDGLQPLQTVTFAGVSRMRSVGVMGAVIPPATVMARVGQSGGIHNFNRTGPPWWSDFTTANPVTPPDSWQRGHLLGSQLGGNGHSTWANMVPLHLNANKSLMVMCENRIVEYINACGDCVIYSATPVYSGNNLHPNYVLLEAVSKNTKANGTPVFRIRVRVYNQPNPPPRVQCQATGSPPPCC